MKKILIVPSETIIEERPASRVAAFFLTAARFVKYHTGQKAFIYDSEIQRYSDIPKILGAENVFVLGELRSHLHSVAVPRTSPYPSCYGTPRGTSIREEEVDDTIRNVDAVLVSLGAGRRGQVVSAKARARGIPIAIIDTRDHQSNYGASDIAEHLSRGLEKGKDYDLYFKNDLPLGYKTDTILPLAPCPIRMESYSMPSEEKDISIFYSGRPRPGPSGCQEDRAETVSLVRQFPGSRIIEHDSRTSFMDVKEYWRYLSRSECALSPSGKAWDSFRHCEVGLAPETALIAPRPYLETTGPPLEDGVNAILYDTEFREGKYHLHNGPMLVEKIQHYLDNPNERKHIAGRWARDVAAGHTVYARSKYIIENIERIL